MVLELNDVNKFMKNVKAYTTVKTAVKVVPLTSILS